MNFLARLRAMLNLGDAGARLAAASRENVVSIDDEERMVRLGDIDGQLARVTAYTKEVNALALKTKP